MRERERAGEVRLSKSQTSVFQHLIMEKPVAVKKKILVLSIADKLEVCKFVRNSNSYAAAAKRKIKHRQINSEGYCAQPGHVEDLFLCHGRCKSDRCQDDETERVPQTGWSALHLVSLEAGDQSGDHL